jgi:CheY-like chemotaxis protein
MPQMSGPELVRALRATRAIDVLYMTGYADDKLNDITESGQLALLRKPFYLDELFGKVVEMLTRNTNRQGSSERAI